MENRRTFIKNASLLGLSPFISLDALKELDLNQEDDPGAMESMEPLIAFPDSPTEWSAYRDKLRAWRVKMHNELKYDGIAYEDTNYEWTQRNFSCYFLMLYDLHVFDNNTLQYTINRIVTRGVEEFGGYDSVVLWHAYPRIGLDQRNQYDYYRDMPGGLVGLRKVVDEFHRHGIKVFIAYYPWDKSTRRESKSDPELLADILEAIDGDGIFLDTLKAAGEEFNQQLDKFKQEGIALESELALDIKEISHHHLSWAQWFNDRFVPGVLRNKWFEPRHMQHQIARWNDDHSTELQLAWMNGSGMMVWENVFGQWMKWKQRDQLTLRIMLPIQRMYWKVFCGQPWTPLVPTIPYGVFASLWEGEGIRLWTLINRNQHAVSGELLVTEALRNHLYFDVMTGEPATSSMKKKTVTLQGQIPARSVHCFISGTQEKFGEDFKKFLVQMKQLNKEDQSAQDNVMVARPQRKVVVTPAKQKGFDMKTMVEIPPATVLLTTTVLSREVGSYESQLPIQLTLNVPIRYNRTVNFPHLAADITPVTNKSFHEFIIATHYEPLEKHHFLNHWEEGMYPTGKENHPVVWVDISDARAYCHWAGKRLPTEEEWQFIAQGFEGSIYPWGKDFIEDNCNSNGMDTTDVFTFPNGKSPFGCLDMCGNTWELTESEYADEHNRFCILKGGSYYKATGSIWYTQGGPQPSTNSIKFLMSYPGLDRSATIGFRCVRDLF